MVHHIAVVARTAHQQVCAPATIQHIVTGVRRQGVVGIAANEQIVQRIARSGKRGSARQGEVFNMGTQGIADAGAYRVIAFVCQFCHGVVHAIDHVGVVSRAALHGVVPRTSVQQVIALLPVKRIVARHAVEFVIAFLAEQCIPAFFAKQFVITQVAAECVIARATADKVIAVTAKGDIVAVFEHQQVGAIAAKNQIVTRTGIHRVIAHARVHDVVALAGVDNVIARACLHQIVPLVVHNHVVALTRGKVVISIGAKHQVFVCGADKILALLGGGNIHNAGAGGSVGIGRGDLGLVLVAQRYVRKRKGGAIGFGSAGNPVHGLPVYHLKLPVRSQIDGVDTHLLQRLVLTRVGDPIAIGVLPHTKAGPFVITRIQNAIAIGVKRRFQRGQIGQLVFGVRDETNFIEAVDFAVAVFVKNQQAVFRAGPGHAALPTVAVDIKEDVTVIHIREVKTIAIEINGNRLFTAPARVGHLRGRRGTVMGGVDSDVLVSALRVRDTHDKGVQKGAFIRAVAVGVHIDIANVSSPAQVQRAGIWVHVIRPAIGIHVTYSKTRWTPAHITPIA